MWKLNDSLYLWFESFLNLIHQEYTKYFDTLDLLFRQKRTPFMNNWHKSILHIKKSKKLS